MPDGKKGFLEKRIQLWLFFVIIAAIFFRLFNISEPSLWTDEISTLWVSTAPTMAETWDRASVTQGMHPAYFLIQHLILSVLPPSEAVLRGLSCTASIISVFLIFWLANLIFGDNIRALLASAIFAIHADSIYYAHEARPYALGIMFALFSQIFLLYLKKKPGIKSVLPYLFCSIAAIYMHYTFAALFLFQNLYVFGVFFLNRKKVNLYCDAPDLKVWIPIQAVCVFFIAFSFPHVFGLYEMRKAWGWVKDLDIISAFALFFSMFDLKILAIMFGVGIFFFFFEKFNLKTLWERLGKYQFVLIVLWLISPIIFVIAVSRLLNAPFFDPRYMLFSMPAYYLLLANFLDIFRSDVIRTAFPGIYLIVYFGFVSIPAYLNGGTFFYRIPHDWRAALNHIKSNYNPGDGILMRYGEVKENWIPSIQNEIVQDYVKSPFYSFYWKNSETDKIPQIMNMTYTWEKQFFNYYDQLFQKLVKRRRVWLIGVDPPNTNYKFSSVAQFMEKEFSFKKISDFNFSGVYVALLESNPILRQKALVPSYYEELRSEIKKTKDKKNNEKD